MGMSVGGVCVPRVRSAPAAGRVGRRAGGVPRTGVVGMQQRQVQGTGARREVKVRAAADDGDSASNNAEVDRQLAELEARKQALGSAAAKSKDDDGGSALPALVVGSAILVTGGILVLAFANGWIVGPDRFDKKFETMDQYNKERLAEAKKTALEAASATAPAVSD